MAIRRDSFLRPAESINAKYLGYNPLPKVKASSRDVKYTIGHGYDERPDLLAQEIYGSSRYWWVFALRNPNTIKDPIRDFKSGTTIMLPSENTVKGLG